MKRIIACLVLLVLLMGLCGCKATGENLKFYVIKEADVIDGMGTDALLQTAKTKGRLAFTAEDLEGWLWAEHTVRLKEVKVKGSAAGGGSVLFQSEKGDRFLVTLNGRVLIQGGFDPKDAGAYIVDAGERDFKIGFEDPYQELTDPRGNGKLYNYLIDLQLLVSEFKEN